MPSAQTPSARVCIVTLRNLYHNVSRCSSFEFEDAILDIDHADVIAPKWNLSTTHGASGTRSLWDSVQRRLSFRVVRERKTERLTIENNYDLLVVVVQTITDLVQLNTLPGWRSRCGRAVCWIAEFWTHDLQWRKQLRLLDNFDDVFLGFHGTVEPLGGLVPGSCHFGPPGIDTLAFCPYPNPPERYIDLYYMGRRSEKTHEALWARAKDDSFYYIFDTVDFAHTDVPHHREHRLALAKQIQRSRYFVANMAKAERIQDTHGQEEIGLRFFEGASAGAVMIGRPPDLPVFTELFDWEDAVIPMKLGETGVASLLEDLDSDAARLERIRRDNVVNSLRRHDWVYRWKMILEKAGLEPLEGVSTRESKLQAMVDHIEADASSAMSKTH